MAFDWTDEAKARLRELWDRKPTLSSRDIGALMDIPKNAVLGQARRLGLTARPQNVMTAKRWIGHVKKEQSPILTRRRRRTASAGAPEPPSPASPRPFRPDARGCLWPAWGGRDAAYWAAIHAGRVLECGDAIPLGGTYCAAHTAKATSARMGGSS